MPRTYKRRAGSRHYQDYTEKDLDEAVDKVLQKKLSLRQAEKKYKIPKSTINYKAKKMHQLPPGRPKVCVTHFVYDVEVLGLPKMVQKP